MEFTGSIGFAMDFNNNTVKTYENFIEQLRKIETITSQKLQCNTGYIFKSNTKRIESLLKSSRAWIIDKGNVDAIALVPISKKLSGKDSDKHLYAYDLQFEINFNK